MKEGDKHGDDWSNDAHSLFQASRFDHDPSAADKLRVQQALALRLSQRAVETASAGEGVAGLGRRATQLIRSSGVVRFVLGAVSIAAVSTLSMLSIERPKETPPVDSSVSVSTSDAATVTPAVEMSGVVERTDAEQGAATKATSTRIETAPRRRASAVRVHTKTGPDRRGRAPSTQAPFQGTPSAADTPPVPSVLAASHETSATAPSNDAPRSGPAVELERPSHVVALPNEAPARFAEVADARAELTLVERIQAALRAHESTRVLELCSEHERRWPDGTFVDEREGIRVLVACSTHATHADSSARVFLAAHPHTPMANRVAAACAAQLSSTTAGTH